MNWHFVFTEDYMPACGSDSLYVTNLPELVTCAKCIALLGEQS